MTAHHRGKVCKKVRNVCRHGCSHTRMGSPPQKKVSVRLRAAVTCAAYFSYFAYTIPKKYAAPEATMSHSH